jgi:hypothetical protein
LPRLLLSLALACFCSPLWIVDAWKILTLVIWIEGNNISTIINGKHIYSSFQIDKKYFLI